MKSIKVTIVRVYITESSSLMQPIVQYLHDVAKVRGVSVFRAISGFGESGEEHASSLIDLSLNLPLVVEFFDHQEKAQAAISHIGNMVRAEHIVYWDAESLAN